MSSQITRHTQIANVISRLCQNIHACEYFWDLPTTGITPVSYFQRTTPGIRTAVRYPVHWVIRIAPSPFSPGFNFICHEQFMSVIIIKLR